MTRQRQPPRARAAVYAVLGCVASVTVLASLAECFLRRFPPQPQQAYLGEASQRRGPFKADETFGVAYASFDDFTAENVDRMQPFLPLPAPGPPLWAFFGNSFVQAPGMLADTLRERVPSRRIFHLGRNEDLIVRFAQIALLLERGLRPERIFVVLMPIDLLGLGAQPLATVQVTDRGAIGYRPRLPHGAGEWLFARSAIARAAWFRAGRQRGNPDFDSHALYDYVDPVLLDDLRRLFTRLKVRTDAQAVPVTVVLIPAYHQVLRGARYGFQDTVAALLSEIGYDVFDPRAAFARAASPTLFVPDKHLSPDGNRLLASALLAHLAERGVYAANASAPPR